MIPKTKIYDSFPDTQFFLDRNEYGGHIINFVRNDIPSKRLSVKKLPTESFLVELNLRKKKCFLSCFCNPNNGIIESHLDIIFKSSDIHSNIQTHFVRGFMI